MYIMLYDWFLRSFTFVFNDLCISSAIYLLNVSFSVVLTNLSIFRCIYLFTYLFLYPVELVHLHNICLHVFASIYYQFYFGAFKVILIYSLSHLFICDFGGWCFCFRFGPTQGQVSFRSRLYLLLCACFAEVTWLTRLQLCRCEVNFCMRMGTTVREKLWTDQRQWFPPSLSLCSSCFTVL